MGAICNEHKPTTCLECIGGATAGEMLSFMAFKSTLILYGALDGQPCSGISPLLFLGKNQRMEAFLLPYYLAELSPEQNKEFAMTSELMCTTELKTHINKRFGLH